MRILKSLLGVGVALMLAASASAQLIPFTYSTTLPTLPASGNLDVGGGNSIHIVGVGGATQNCDVTVGGTDILLANYNLANNPSSVWNFSGVPYTVTLTIEGNAYDLQYALSGNVGPGTANVTSQYISGFPISFTTMGTPFNVTQGVFTPPAPFGNPLVGSLNAHVACLNPIPEPGSFALLGVGLLPMLGLIRRRK